MRFGHSNCTLVLIIAGCGGGGGGSGGNAATVPSIPDRDPAYNVAIISDSALPPGSCTAPLFAPGDLSEPIDARSIDLNVHLAQTGFIGESEPMFVFPRHLDEGGPTLALDSGLDLTDDIRFEIETNSAGQFTGIVFKGQPLIGPDSLSHESDVIDFNQSVEPLDTQQFVAHVDSMQPIPMWQLDSHLGGDKVGIAGNFCVGDLVFSPVN